MIWKVNNNEIKMKRPRLAAQQSSGGQGRQTPTKRKLNRAVKYLILFSEKRLQSSTLSCTIQ